MPGRSRVVALVLSLAGFLGLHRFYLGRFWTGLLMLVTLGGFGIWWIVDIYLVLTGKLRDGDKQALVWFGGGSHPETPYAVAPTLQPREASEQAQTSEAEPTRPDEERRGAAGMSTISLPGQTKVSTLQERFKSEFGLTLRVYDGRSFADPSATIGQVRKKRGATSIDIRRNTKVGNLEDRFMADFGIKVQIAGSDDSYLCDNDLTLAAALEEDERKLGRKAAGAAAGEGQESDSEHGEEGVDMSSQYENYDHKFCEIFRLGENPQDPICGGDPDTWGEGFKIVGEVNIFSPTRGTEGPTIMYIGAESIDLLDWEIEYGEITNFIKKLFTDHLSDKEMDFLLWYLTDTILGEDYGIAGHMAGEFPHSELGDSEKNLLGACVFIKTFDMNLNL